MAHLACKDHKRRVVMLPSGNAYHRNGDGSKCDSESLMFSGSPVVMSLLRRTALNIISKGE